MRVLAVFLLIPVIACGERDRAADPAARPSFDHDPVRGETRARIATGRGSAAEMRSGAAVPVSLPRGITIYPGARVTGNTLVTRAGARRTLVEFQTSDPIAEVLLFHRAQAQAAGVTLTLDLDGQDAASIGGRLASGGDYALTARRAGPLTLVELSVSEPAGTRPS